jgi:spermidine/putrescine transport system permease protein
MTAAFSIPNQSTGKRPSYTEQRKRTQVLLLVWPAALWLITFFVVPFLVVVAYSLMTPSRSYQAMLPFTLGNYEFVLREQFISVITRSVGIALIATLVCVLLGYPLAFFIATRPKNIRNIFLLLVIVPFWTNFLVRIYAWIFLIRENGLIDSFLRDTLKIITTPFDLMYSPIAVFLVLLCGYLPFMTLPIYTSIEKFNFRLVEAAHDLGANDIRAFLRVMLPVTIPGVLAGSILTFIPALGSFVVPDLVGGASFLMVGNQITNFTNTATGKTYGAALSMVMMVIVLVALLINYRFGESSSSSNNYNS